MKKFLSVLIILLIYQLGFGQHGGIYHEWYLVNYELDGINYGVSQITPAVSPSLTIENDLQFYGTAACNDYSGNFIYDQANDELIVDTITFTSDPCGFQSHTDFETDYFSLFAEGNSFHYGIIYDINGVESLWLFLPNGDNLYYDSFPPILSSGQVQHFKIDIYPNPVSDILNITSDKYPVDKLVVYDLTGQQLISNYSPAGKIDVSGLSDGMYFLEILSEGRSQVHTFLKQ